jgi:DNA mismatch repair protein MutL
MIELLPENVANQIAAGEVIQRPSSAVKELLENAVDARSTKIQLIVKDAGKSLVQVIDNGFGMNASDAEKCFKKHATSKIKSADDLFNISSKGFRGEALSSIAAIAHVELKTRTPEDDIGTQVIMEGNKLVKKETIACPIGTSFAMKNLFFNVPARRNFLKSDNVETKHIIDEFQRVAMAHHDIHFTMHHNEHLLFDLPSANRKQRILSIFGKKYNERLVPIEETTSISKIHGFVVKPEFAKRTRGEQFIFVNNRFIKNSSINHAINVSFKDLISKEHFPSYFLFIEVPTNTIDVNIHPTKTEIKFEDERAIYTMIKSCVRNSLGKYNVAPTLDFETESSFNLPPIEQGKTITPPSIKVNPNYNPFHKETKGYVEENLDLIQQNFQKEFDHSNQNNYAEDFSSFGSVSSQHFLSYKNRYVVTTQENGLLLIDLFRAHQQIKFEELKANYSNVNIITQKLLHPLEVDLSSGDIQLCVELKEEFLKLGVEIDQFGKDSVVIHSFPTTSTSIDARAFIESCLESFKHENTHFEHPYEKIAWGIAESYAYSRLNKLKNEEINHLMESLFSLASPKFNVKGLPILSEIDENEISKMFK